MQMIRKNHIGIQLEGMPSANSLNRFHEQRDRVWFFEQSPSLFCNKREEKGSSRYLCPRVAHDRPLVLSSQKLGLVRTRPNLLQALDPAVVGPSSARDPTFLRVAQKLGLVRTR